MAVKNSPSLLAAQASAKGRKLPVTEVGDESFAHELSALADAYAALDRKFAKTLRISDSYQLQIREMASSLERMASKISQLQELTLPVCLQCRKIRIDDDYWRHVERFLIDNSEMLVSQALCPDCLRASHGKLDTGGVSSAAHIGARPPSGRPVARFSLSEEQTLKEMREAAAQMALTDPEMGMRISRFAASHEKLVRRFAKTVSISDSYQSQLKDLALRLDLLARTDALTGLVNRREMMQRLAIEYSRMHRHATPCSIVFGDIDHFKQINDRCGHTVGDYVLRAVARALRENIRGEDLCARWGGEEFMLFFSDTALDNAMAAASKLLDIVRSLEFDWEGGKINVTISFGVVQLRPGLSLDDGFRQADEALYEAKRLGRNQVIAFRGTDQ